jgi:translocation and assembly module TamB
LDAPAPKRHRRHWRIVRHTVGVLVLLVCLLVIGLLWALRNLDTGLVKQRLRNLVLSQGGLELNYASAEADLFTGLSLHDITVASPPEFEGVAPTLVKAGVLRLGWSLFGSGATLKRLTARDVEVTIVIDEHGRTSLDALGNGARKPAPTHEPTPGEQLVQAVQSLPDFERLSFRAVTVNILQTRAGRVVARTRVSGIDLRTESTGEGPARHVDVGLGDKGHPLEVSARYDGALHGDGAGKLWLDADLDARSATVRAELTLDRQSLSPAWPAHGMLFAIDGKATADGDKLEVALQRLEAAAEAVVLKGDVLLGPGSTRIDDAKGKLDLTRLAQMVPSGLPLRLREGSLKYDVSGLELQPAPKLDDGGHLDLNGRAADFRYGAGDEHVELDEMRLVVKGKPVAGGGIKLNIELPAGVLTLAQGRQHLTLQRANTTLEATLSPGVPGQVELRTRFDALAASGVGQSVHASQGAIDLRLGELRFDPKAPAETSAAIALSVGLGALDGTLPNLSAHAGDVALTAHAQLVKGAPSGLDVELPIGRLVVDGAHGTSLLPSGPAKLQARVEHVKVDRAVPLFTTADAHVALAAAGMTFAADVKKLRDGLDFKVALDAQKAALLASFAPARLELPGARMALTLAANGHLERLLAPRIKAHTVVHIDRPGVTVADQALAATTLDLALDVDGDAQKQALALTITPKALTLEDEALGDGTLTAHAAWDLARSTVSLTLDGQGQALPSGTLAIHVAFDHRTRSVDYRVDGNLAHLAALTPLLPESLTDAHWLDLSDVRAKVASRGQLSGVFVAVDRRGVPVLAPRPLESLRGNDEFSLTVENFHYVDAAGVELTVPSLTLTTHASGSGDSRRADADLSMAAATLLSRGHRVEVGGMHDHVALSTEGDPLVDKVEIKHELELAKVAQDWLPFYRIGGLTMTTHGRREDDGTLHLDELTLHNQDGGTTVTAKGGLLLARGLTHQQALNAAPPVGFSSIGTKIVITQQLAAISDAPTRFVGKGALIAELDLASGDLRRYHATSSLKFQHASIDLPQQHMRIDDLDGMVPLVEDFVLKKGQATFIKATEMNAYPQLRFADQHAFQSHSGALHIERVSVGGLDVTDIAVNLRVTRNQLAIDQIDASVRKGRIAGSSLIDWRGANSTASLRLRLSGIEATHGDAHERFDGNMALNLSLAERSLDGRVEVLRIGRHHLLDLLDEYDPHHQDSATNRVRTALALGYPERVHLLFDRGFASFSVAFGGLARLIKVAEVKGIATGPLVERYLGPVLSLENSNP